MKTIVITESLHVDIEANGKATVREISDETRYGGKYTERRRTFKTAKSAAAKLRKELEEALLSEQESGEVVEAGDAKWKNGEYPLRTALEKLEVA